MHGVNRGTLYIKHERECDKLQIANAWTINLDEVSEDCTDIIFFTEKCKYCIPFKKAKSLGTEKVFKGERKLVVPVSLWTQEKYRKE